MSKRKGGGGQEKREGRREGRREGKGNKDTAWEKRGKEKRGTLIMTCDSKPAWLSGSMLLGVVGGWWEQEG